MKVTCFYVSFMWCFLRVNYQISSVNLYFTEEEDLNIIGIVLESVGKLAWLRHAPELHKYITVELGGVLLEKHTKVALNTGGKHKHLIFTVSQSISYPNFKYQ